MKTPLITLCAGVAGWLAASATRPDAVSDTRPPSPLNARLAETRNDAAPRGGSDSAKPITERLSDAFDVRDPFAQCARLIEVLDGMNAEDFERFITNPGSVPSAHRLDDYRLGQSFIDAVVARWIEVNPAGALDQIKRLEKALIINESSVRAGSGDYFAALSRLNPRLLLDDAEWVNHPKTKGDLVATAFEMLARKDIHTARAYLERLGSPSLRKQAAKAIAEGLAYTDPAAAAAIARAENDESIFHSTLRSAGRLGAAEVRAVLQVNARKFDIGDDLAELIMKYPDEDWTHFAKDNHDAAELSFGVTSEMTKLWTRKSPEERRAVLDKVSGMPKAAQGPILATFLMPWVSSEPRAAMDWVIQQKDLWSADSAVAGLPFGIWAKADRPAATAWLAAQPESAGRAAMSDALSLELASAGELDAAESSFRKEGKTSEEIRVYAEAIASRDPERAAKWLGKLPEGLDEEKAATTIAERWAETDARKAAAWVESLPAGSRRDAAISGFAGAVMEKDVTAAAEWVATIADDSIRAKAAGTVYGEWLSRDPYAAQRWLRELPGIDETYRSRLLRRGWR